MIEDLTKKRLEEIWPTGKAKIEEVLKSENQEAYFNLSYKGEYFLVVVSEKKIYSGIDAYESLYFKPNEKPIFPIRCPDLLLNYHYLSFEYYKSHKKKELGAVFFLSSIKTDFIQIQINETERLIDQFNKNPTLNKAIEVASKSGEEKGGVPYKEPIQTCKTYLDFLKAGAGSFELLDLLEEAYELEIIPKPINEFQKAANFDLYHYNFTVWLQEKKGLEFGNEIQYRTLSTRDNWKEFLEFERLSEKEKEIQKNKELNKLRAEYLGEVIEVGGENHLKALPPQQPETETPTFTNNFDNIKPTEIYKHFKTGLVEKGYLTEQELNEYLKAAFELKTIPETLFKIKDAPKKAAIESIFYKYYKNVAGKIHGKQKQYAALLGNYFEGFKTSTVSSNFSKSVY